MTESKETFLERRALRIEQNPTMPVYLFALAAEEISLVADVARISRDEAGKLIGYQRPERRAHVRHILEYLDEGDVLFPNGLILALPDTVRFRSSRGPGTTDGLATSGTLEIPVPSDDAAQRPAWIVDGQQRSLALARTKNARIPVPVAGFVAPTLEMQRDQFLRINTVAPLPANLVTELLPEVISAPSPRLSQRRMPSALVDMLNRDPESPFFGLIKRASTEVDDRRQSVVTDTSLVEAIRESLESPSGVLFPYRNMATGSTDTDGIRRVLLTYWGAVRETFPDAWGKPPTTSKLMGGVGIRAMGRLMDRVMVHIDLNSSDPQAATRRELARIADQCRWTNGTWSELGLPWNELQNVAKHISSLSNYLARAYVAARKEQP
ncbi:DGQHR domain-containing protein DpdB [Mycobacterium asiaticum]|uniref:DGQHR domain-containing protein DpdB n=1 Tax=Mycobacterium asiaticum TaxID=1790 RepID=UPI00055DD2B1|nr:DGQHR domain-containing protein DpdB [Mycobacterium asiaticum]ORA15565.1 DGQHR domain-containing protein [Mycobacterium asiaticum DSM 44297]